MAFYVCHKCGEIDAGHMSFLMNYPFCGYGMGKVEEDPNDYIEIHDPNSPRAIKIRSKIPQNEIDQDLWERREKYDLEEYKKDKQKDDAYVDRQYSKIMSSPVVTCPYCKSTNTTKISALSKAGKYALFGVLAIGANSKQWHCNNCNSNF